MPRPARGKQIVLGALNIASNPHPPGTYIEILRKIAEIEVELWGNDSAKITKPVKRRNSDEIYVGRILVWTTVDREGAWIDKETNLEATQERMEEITIPDVLEPNFRTFNYAFSVPKHRFIFEVRNEFGQRFSHTRAERLLTILMSPQYLGAGQPDVSVTVIPEDDSLERILSINKLRRLEIHLKRPNPDDLGDHAARLLRELEGQGAKSQSLVLTKAPGVHSIVPNEDTKLLAKVASENGFVKGKGSDEEGHPVDESTREYPKQVPIDVADDQSAGVRFLFGLARLL